MAFDQVMLISNADWSINARKRWQAVAIRAANSSWVLRAPQQVSNPSDLFIKLLGQLAQPGCILSGFDFPIGIPYQYALKAGISDYLSFLSHLGSGSWDRFYEPAEHPSQISIYRPFYPLKPGNSKRQHLEKALDLSFSQLHRLCEMAHENRRSACPLFWTMGAQQVGKAAISGWKYVLAPGLKDPQVNLKIWPFSGPLDRLCGIDQIVVLETYPAEFYGHLGLSFSSANKMSKRRQSDRVRLSNKLLKWVEKSQFELEPALEVSLLNGFGCDDVGEDRFDAFIGLCGMINVVLGLRASGEPLSPPISTIEGWIFGQEQSR